MINHHTKLCGSLYYILHNTIHLYLLCYKRIAASESILASASGVDVRAGEVGVRVGVLVRGGAHNHVRPSSKGTHPSIGGGEGHHGVLVVGLQVILRGGDGVRVGEGEDKAVWMSFPLVVAFPWLGGEATKEVPLLR